MGQTGFGPRQEEQFEIANSFNESFTSTMRQADIFLESSPSMSLGNIPTATLI